MHKNSTCDGAGELNLNTVFFGFKMQASSISMKVVSTANMIHVSSNIFTSSKC